MRRGRSLSVAWLKASVVASGDITEYNFGAAGTPHPVVAYFDDLGPGASIEVHFARDGLRLASITIMHAGVAVAAKPWFRAPAGKAALETDVQLKVYPMGIENVFVDLRPDGGHNILSMGVVGASELQGDEAGALSGLGVAVDEIGVPVAVKIPAAALS